MAHSPLYRRIMNSKRWHEVRARKVAQNPLCEECQKEGIVKPTQCVHHITEIESAKTDAEAWDLATSFNNLVSLCFDCHHKIHTQRKSHSKAMHKERNKTRLQQWAARHFAVVLLALMLTSCATRRITDAVTLRDTIRITQHDSTIINHRDSIYIHEWQRGDTIHLTEYRERIEYRDRLRVDTFYQHKTDTITKTVTTGGRAASLPWWLKFLLGVWVLFSTAFTASVGIFLLYWKIKQ